MNTLIRVLSIPLGVIATVSTSDELGAYGGLMTGVIIVIVGEVLQGAVR